MTASFIREFVACTDANPFNRRERVLGCAAIALQPRSPDIVQLNMLRALLPSGGHGSRALRWLCRLADQHSVTLVGCVVPTAVGKYKRPLLNRRQLTQWYRRQGFVVYRDGHMERQPAQLRVV